MGINRANELHMEIGNYLRQKTKKGFYTGTGNLLKLIGAVDLIATGFAHYGFHKAGKVSGLDLFFGKFFYSFLPVNEKVGVTVAEVVNKFNNFDAYLAAGYAVGIAALVTGYLLKRKAKKV